MPFDLSRRFDPAGKGAPMATILGLRLPYGYVAERHPGHIAVSFHGTLLGEVAHDIAPRELEARVNRHLFAGCGDVLPTTGVPATGSRFVNRFPERDRDEADRERTTPAGLEWLVSHVADDKGEGADVHLICDSTGAWICPSATDLWTRFTASA